MARLILPRQAHSGKVRLHKHCFSGQGALSTCTQQHYKEPETVCKKKARLKSIELFEEEFISRPRRHQNILCVHMHKKRQNVLINFCASGNILSNNPAAGYLRAGKSQHCPIVYHYQIPLGMHSILQLGKGLFFSPHHFLFTRMQRSNVA